MPGTIFPPPWVSDPDVQHGTCVTHVPWCMPGSVISNFLLNRWRGKRSRHSQCMQSPYVSGKRPILWRIICWYIGIVNGILHIAIEHACNEANTWYCSDIASPEEPHMAYSWVNWKYWCMCNGHVTTSLSQIQYDDYHNKNSDIYNNIYNNTGKNADDANDDILMISIMRTMQMIMINIIMITLAIIMVIVMMFITILAIWIRL